MATLTLRPDADVVQSGTTYSSGTTAWDKVDETTLNTGDWYDNKVVSSYTVMSFPASGLGSVTINSVQINWRGANAAPANSGRTIIRDPSSGTRYDIDTISQSASTLTGVASTTRPWGGSWTKADVDAIEVGTRGPTSGTLNKLRTTQLWIVVDYTVVQPTATLTATGGGVVVLSGTKAGAAAVTATGGGVAVLAQSTARSGSVSCTGGGVVTVAATSARSSTAALTGGGVVTYTYAVGGTVETHSGTASLTGGGVVAVAALAGRQAAVTATGGGVVAVTSTADHRPSVTLTGGGVVTPVHSGAHSGVAVLTGGGVVTIAYTIPGLWDLDGTASLTGGGSITIGRARIFASMNFPSVALDDHYEYPRGPDDPGWLP